MLAAAAGLAVLAWGVLRTSGEDDGAAGNVTATATGGASPSATPIPGDTVFEPFTITNPESTKLLFIRNQTTRTEPGSLWMSNLDGSNAEILIDEPGVVGFLDIIRHWQTGNPTIYFTLREERPAPTSDSSPEGHLTVFTLDLATGRRAEVLDFDTWGGQDADSADPTTDGRYIAYTDISGLAVLDTSTGETRRILGEEPRGLCDSLELAATASCSSFARPLWNPGDNRLAIYQGFYEGGRALIVEPFSAPPQVISIDNLEVFASEWSRSGDSLCAVDGGAYDNGVGLVVARAPDWQQETFLTDYPTALLPPTPNLSTTSYGRRAMWGCVWLDDRTVAVMHSVFIQPQQSPKEILVLNLETSGVRDLREHNEFTGSRNLVAVPERNLLISQFQHYAEYPDPIGDLTTPEVVDAETGARAPILTTKDRVVAAVSAELLAP
jgi:hypothetical protein